ncbi:MAG: hypothetical protein M1825_002479 [Sarcosagium campestre]|nr:MAG: hypothetical protein M1825_002479 [Sarcosagium campestre]
MSISQRALISIFLVCVLPSWLATPGVQALPHVLAEESALLHKILQRAAVQSEVALLKDGEDGSIKAGTSGPFRNAPPEISQRPFRTSPISGIGRRMYKPADTPSSPIPDDRDDLLAAAPDRGGSADSEISDSSGIGTTTATSPAAPQEPGTVPASSNNATRPSAAPVDDNSRSLNAVADLGMPEILPPEAENPAIMDLAESDIPVLPARRSSRLSGLRPPTPPQVREGSSTGNFLDRKRPLPDAPAAPPPQRQGNPAKPGTRILDSRGRTCSVVSDKGIIFNLGYPGVPWPGEAEFPSEPVGLDSKQWPRLDANDPNDGRRPGATETDATHAVIYICDELGIWHHVPVTAAQLRGRGLALTANDRAQAATRLRTLRSAAMPNAAAPRPDAHLAPTLFPRVGPYDYRSHDNSLRENVPASPKPRKKRPRKKKPVRTGPTNLGGADDSGFSEPAHANEPAHVNEPMDYDGFSFDPENLTLEGGVPDVWEPYPPLSRGGPGMTWPAAAQAASDARTGHLPQPDGEVRKLFEDWGEWPATI